jgi:prepilin-type N-terminal cleavage/methylation domain-containing protein
MLSNIKSLRKERGFTIVELLVVIVVIGILAAITVVAYTGVTNKAKTSQAQSNANSAMNVAETYNSEFGYYPTTTGAFGSATYAKMPGGVSVIVGLPGVAGAFTGTEPLNGTNGQTSVGWACSGGTASAGNCTGNTGGRITFWDFSASTPARSTTIYYVGAASVASTFFSPAS